MKALAQELIDAILGELEAIETENRWVREVKGLKSCSLVARNFRGPSQRRLFRKFTLSARSGATKGLADSPHLASYVRNLYVTIGDKRVADDVEKARPMANYDELTSIFPLLTGVQRLVLAVSQFWYIDSSPSFRSALCSLLSLPSLRCLAFKGVGIPSALVIHALSSCKAVALHAFDLLRSSEEQLVAPVDAGTAWISHLIIPKVDRLVLEYWPEQYPALHDLMLSADVQKCLENLQSLTIKVLAGGSLGGLEDVIVNCSSIQL
jgi:hypothetical protein